MNAFIHDAAVEIQREAQEQDDAADADDAMWTTSRAGTSTTPRVTRMREGSR